MNTAPPADSLSLRQQHESECGITCLAMVLRFHGFPDLRRRLTELAYVELGQNLHRDADMLALCSLAEHLGCEANGYQGDLELLSAISLPCIAHRRDQRFVVVWGISSQEVEIGDPATGERHAVPITRFADDWSGVVLEISPTDRALRETEAHRSPLHESGLERLLREHDAQLATKGGFASIYCACWRGEQVALKVVPAYARDTDSAARAFRREASVRQLCGPHPHITKLIDVDWTNRALVLEWADRGSLADVTGPIPVTRALRYTAQIAEALTALHGLGITHRDVTPGNILLFSRDIAKLADFGISRSRSDSRDDDVEAKYISCLFSSPEQLRGDEEGSPSDVFSLALTLFFAIAGGHLFEPELDTITLDRRDPSFTSVLESKLRPVLVGSVEALVRTRLHARRGVDDDVVAALLARCLAYAPAARIDAAQLVHGVHLCLVREGDHARV